MPNGDEIHEFRVDVDRRLVRLEAELESMVEKLDTVISTIGQQSVIIRTFEDERMRSVGATGMVKYLVGLMGAGLMSIAYNLHDIMMFFFPPKH